MAIQSPQNRISVPKWVSIVLVTLFVAIWGSLMTAGMSFRGCTERPLTDLKKSAYCNTSIMAGAFLDLFPLERAKRSPLFLERGIMRAVSGDLEAAKEDFRKALLDAAGAQQNAEIKFPRDLALPRIAHLFTTMEAEPSYSAATTTWLEVVRELSCGSADIGVSELCAVP
jgi:hypothetical protein